MATNLTSLQLAERLVSQFYEQNGNFTTGIVGGRGGGSTLFELRQASVELVKTIREHAALAARNDAIGSLEATLRSAQLVGFLSQTEFENYMQTIDTLYEVTEKES